MNLLFGGSMPEHDGTCEYVLDPNNPDIGTWPGGEDECYVFDEILNENGVWECPYGTKSGNEMCIFHLPVTKKDDKETTDAFLQELNQANTSDDSDEGYTRFVGARFGEFDLSETPRDITIEGRILSMAYTEITGILDWSGFSIDGLAINLSGIRCTSSANFNQTEFGGYTLFSRAEFADGSVFSGAIFDGDAHFWQTEFNGETRFDQAEFNGETRFKQAEFNGETRFRKAQFREDINFMQTKFDEGVYFGQAEFETVVRFGNATFAEEAYFGDTEFERDVAFWWGKFEGDARFPRADFGGNTNFGSTEFKGEAVFIEAKFGSEAIFNQAEFGGDTDFSQVEFGGVTQFINSEFTGIPSFARLSLDETRFDGADLTDAIFTETNLCRANFESALMSRAVISHADLRGAKLSGTVLGDVRIDENTQFLGHPSDDNDSSPHTLSAIRSRPTCVYDPAYEEDNVHANVDRAKSVYGALEELGRKHARSRLQARSLVRRKDLQKEDYWDDATAEGASLEERLIAGFRWSRAKVAQGIFLYGESPWRIIGWSLATIFGFALLFPLGGWMRPEGGDPITYEQIGTNLIEFGNSVYYSTLTFTALGFGDFRPVGFGRVLTTIETGLGAVLLALLVFVLGRRAAR